MHNPGLIQVVPEISLNGNVILQGNPQRLGDEVTLSYQFSRLVATYAPVHYQHIAGSYVNIPLIAQSVIPGKREIIANRSL